MTLNGTLLVLVSIIIMSTTTYVTGYDFEAELEEEKHEGDGPYRPQFSLYTRGQSEPHSLIVNHINSITNSPLKEDKNLYFIIHGYRSSGEKSWVLDMKQELLDREDCNVVTVDWKYGAAWIYYVKSVYITTSVGSRTSRLIAQLIVYGKISPTRIHVIGHSLGAHTAGDVGYNLRNQYGYTLGRITGLDPAGPLFSGNPPRSRLDSTDATFVSVIHSDIATFGFGIARPVGHIDFYPNGGKKQPACVKGGITCDHSQSYKYFIESINTKCPYWAVACESWEEFMKGNCFDCANQECRKFGFDVQPKKSVSSKSFYLLTGPDNKICRETYRIKINLACDRMKNKEGQFLINMIGVNGKMTGLLRLSRTSQSYKLGSTHTVVLWGQSVGKLQSVKLLWKTKNTVLGKRDDESTIRVKSVTVDILKPGDNSITVRPPRARALVNNEEMILRKGFEKEVWKNGVKVDEDLKMKTCKKFRKNYLP